MLQASKAAVEAAEELARLAEEKATADFQIQEVDIQLAELRESLAAANAKLVTRDQEAQEATKYQQEIEGKFSARIQYAPSEDNLVNCSLTAYLF